MSNNPLNSYQIESFAHSPHIIPGASQQAAGVMSAADKSKLDSIAAGAIGAIINWTPSVSWSSVYAQIVAARAAGGGVVVMLKDDGTGNPWVIGAGIYSFDDVVLAITNANSSSFGVLEIGPGVTISGESFTLQGAIFCLYTGTLWTGKSFTLNLFDFAGFVPSTTTQPPAFFVNDSSGNGLVINMDNGCFLGSPATVPTAGHEIIQAVSGVFLQVSCEGAVLQAGTFGKSGGGANPFIVLTPSYTSWIDPDAVRAGYDSSISYIGSRSVEITGSGALEIKGIQIAGISTVKITANGNITSLKIPCFNIDDGRQLNFILVQGPAGTETWPANFSVGTGGAGPVFLPSGTTLKPSTGANQVDTWALIRNKLTGWFALGPPGVHLV